MTPGSRFIQWVIVSYCQPFVLVFFKPTHVLVMSPLLSSCTLVLQAVLGSSVLFCSAPVIVKESCFLCLVFGPQRSRAVGGLLCPGSAELQRVRVCMCLCVSTYIHVYVCGVSLAHYFFLYFYILKNTSSLQYPQFPSYALQVSPLVVNSLFNSDHPSAGCSRQQTLSSRLLQGLSHCCW